MDPESRAAVEVFVNILPSAMPLEILQVGGRDVNGSVPSLFARDPWRYVSIDIQAGPNVDLVLADGERWSEVAGASQDVVIALSVLEHTPRPWKVMPEIARVLRPGGAAFVTVPHTWEFHDHPADYWRILPEGLRMLFEDAGLESKMIWSSHGPEDGFGCKRGQTFGWASKPA